MKKSLKASNGITLIALVITIIVILILAGVSISMLSGDNSILQRATDSKEKTTVAGEKEQLQLEVLGSHESDGALLIGTVNSNIKNHISGVTTDDATEFPLTVTYTTTGNKYEVYEDGKVDVKGPSITEYVKVGDYVDYDPTYSDAQKTKKVDANKLTYTSPTGTATEHGNGYMSSETGGGQKFTAKSTEESGIKWRVLSVTDNKIEIIPNNVIKKDNGSTTYILKGARGYLYAEQELNEICKIYGYGYGTDTSIGSIFKIGGPYPGEEEIRQITGTGARSIKIGDINKLAGIYENETDGKMKYSDGTDINANYGSTTKPISKVFYPTINTSLGDDITGISNLAGIKNLKNTSYTYSKSKIIESSIGNLFNRPFWIASRYVYAWDSNAYFFVYYMCASGVDGNFLLNCYTSTVEELSYSNSSGNNLGVLPVVTIKPNVIDISNANENIGQEGYAWKLK